MAIAYAHLAPWTPGSNLAVRVNRAIDDRPGIQQEAICYQWFKQRLILSVTEPSISQRSQIKEDTVEPSVPAREFNLKAYTAITWHNDQKQMTTETEDRNLNDGALIHYIFHSVSCRACPIGSGSQLQPDAKQRPIMTWQFRLSVCLSPVTSNYLVSFKLLAQEYLQLYSASADSDAGRRLQIEIV